MFSPELEKKIQSFSEHTGLGKTYSRYELIYTGQGNFVPPNPGDVLPKRIRIIIKPFPKTELIYLILITCICLLIMASLRDTGGRQLAFIYIPFLWFVAIISGISAIKRVEQNKKDIMIMDETAISYNRDIFDLTELETTLLKKDLDKSNKLVTLWLLVVKMNGEMYSYEIPLRYATKKLKFGYKLEELLFHYREYRKLNVKMGK